VVSRVGCSDPGIAEEMDGVGQVFRGLCRGQEDGPGVLEETRAESAPTFSARLPPLYGTDGQGFSTSSDVRGSSQSCAHDGHCHIPKDIIGC